MYAQISSKNNTPHLTIIKSANNKVKAYGKFKQQSTKTVIFDDLTALPNRDFFIRQLNSSINVRKTYKKISRFAILFIDVDNSKLMNDSWGDSLGDQLVVTLAKYLEEIVGNQGFLARLGGNEFGILIENISDLIKVEELAKNINRYFSYPIAVQEKNIFVSVSIGIVQYSTNYDNAEDMLRDADIAMYRAKLSHKDPYVIFDSIMHKEVVNRTELQKYLSQAVEELSKKEKSQFKLHYQPIVNLEDGKITGMEVLLRWVHPEKGLIAPDKFISLAEETGLIIPLGNWIFEEACKQLAKWQKKFPDAHNLTLSINVSASQFHQANFVEQIQQIFENNAIAPSNINLEITESLLMENDYETLKQLEQIRALGVKLSLDDFGTGYSCLSYLHKLPIDTLKIDRSFVESLDKDYNAIVKTIIILGHSLNMNVVAEGVETIEHKNLLKQLNCDLAQGYLFSKAVPGQIVEMMLRCI